jgi:hypothetical protein
VVGVTTLMESIGAAVFEITKASYHASIKQSSNNDQLNRQLQQQSPGSKENKEHSTEDVFPPSTVGLSQQPKVGKRSRSRHKRKFRMQLSRVTEVSEHPTSQEVTAVS